MKTPLILGVLAVASFCSSCSTGPGGVLGRPSSTSASAIRTKSAAALNQLYTNNPKALALARQAEGVLVFPEITKGGLLVGGAYGQGALFQRGQVTSYYESTAASYGLQAGLQKYGYALILMDRESIASLNRSDGWNVGSAPHLTVVDKGAASSLSVRTAQKGTYAFFFNQKGLMGGLGLEGSKITRVIPQKP